MILYLHGFRSSPQSYKARLLAQALAQRGLSAAWHCPQLPASPAAAMQLALIQARRLQADASGGPSRLTVIGSSLGGFYATWLAERLGCRAVLLNPVVHAARDLATQVGMHRSFYGDEPFEFLPAHVAELARAEADVVTLSRLDRYLLLAATGDEVLNWREMQARFVGCRQHIIQGSDHGLTDFASYLPEVLDFALAHEALDAESTRSPRPADDCTPDGCRIPGAADGVRVEVGPWDRLGEAAAAIRTEVFVQEQGVLPEEELDGSDARCLHALARDEAGRPVGTGRLLPDGHIGRMAVRAAWRGRGVGSALLAALMEAARSRGDAQVVLAAQWQARGFYTRHGFTQEGEPFLDAGIRHILMRCPLL